MPKKSRRKNKKRNLRTRKKRGGVERWTRETLQPNPKTFDDIGYFYDCKPMPHVGSTNKSKYRENMIITGDRDANQLMLPDKWKIIRMDDSEFYDPQLQLVDMALPEGERGMRWFRRRAQQLCNRGYKPLKRNDAKTGAGRKKKTRKKRGGWKRNWYLERNEEPYYECPKKEPPREWRYKEGIIISDDSVKPPQEAQELKIEEMEDTEYSRDPMLVMNHTVNPHPQSFSVRADSMCNAGFRPLKRNDAKIGAGRKKKTRKKRGGFVTDEQIYTLMEPLILGLQAQIDEHNTQIQELEEWQDAYEELNLEERIEALERQRSGTGGTGGGKRKKKTRKKRGGRFVDVTPEYIRKNFDQLVGREVELSEEGVQKKIIIYKLRDETDDIVDYKDIIPIPTFFYYINVDDNQDIQTPRPLGVIDLTEYGPGSIKINVANIQDGSGKRKKKTRKKKGAVKFGKNKTTAEIVKEGRKILQTTPQKKKRQIREQQIKLIGEQEFSLFKKQAMDKMKIAFIKSFNQPPSVKDGKMLSLVYKSLKQPLNKKENEIIQDYRSENNINKRKLVWMNNSARQLREISEKTKHQIYNTGDDPEIIKKYRPRKKQIKMGPASGLVIDTDKYMSPVKGPDTRYPKLSLDIGERGKTNKKLFKGGNGEEKVPTPSFRDIVRQTIANNWTQINNDSEISNHGTMENMINTFINQPRDTQLRMMRAYDDRNGTQIFQHLYEIPVESQKINEIYSAQKEMEGGKRKKKRRTRKKNRR